MNLRVNERHIDQRYDYRSVYIHFNRIRHERVFVKKK